VRPFRDQRALATVLNPKLGGLRPRAELVKESRKSESRSVSWWSRRRIMSEAELDKI